MEKALHIQAQHKNCSSEWATDQQANIYTMGTLENVLSWRLVADEGQDPPNCLSNYQQLHHLCKASGDHKEPLVFGPSILQSRIHQDTSKIVPWCSLRFLASELTLLLLQGRLPRREHSFEQYLFDSKAATLQQFCSNRDNSETLSRRLLE